MSSPSNLLAPTDEVAARQLGLSADVIAQLGPAANVLAGEDEIAAKRRRRQTTLVDLGEVVDLGEEVVDLAEEVVEAAEQPKKKKMWKKIKDAVRSVFKTKKSKD